jgi:cytochrome oxidase assembly protein ShyY1
VKQLLRPKWIAGHVIIVVLTVAFVTAGFWQIARNNEAKDKLAQERADFAQPAPDVGSVDVEQGAPTNERVSATGRFDAAHQALLRNRSRGDALGYDVLTPLRLDGGGAVVVDRGWVSLDAVANGIGDAAVPTGTVTVRGVLQRATRLREGEAVKQEGGLASLPRVDTDHLGQQTGYALLPAYLEAQYQSPAPAAGAPALPEPKKTSQVNHISYALQWFAFALIAVIGWPIVLRRSLRRSAPAASRPHPVGAGTR